MQKYLRSVLLFLVTATSAWAQDVTFRVDMRNETVAGPVRLTGGFAGWYDGKLEMSDPDNDDIYELTLRLLPGRYEYKFLKGNWAGAESLSSPSAAYCTINSNGNVNRILEVGQSDTLLPVVCFDSCLACGQSIVPAPVNVTFQVDMSALGSGTTYVTGNSLDNWCGNCIQMTDANNDKVYQVTMPLMPGMHEFKFTRNGWSNGEVLLAGSPCTVTNFNFTNRSVYVPMGASAVTLPAAPFNGCAPHAVNMYLEVDLNGVQADPAGVFVSGNFNNWSATASPMENLGHGLWGRNVVAIVGDTLRYRFLNGAAGEVVAGVCADAAGVRMQVVPEAQPRLAAVCFGGCTPCDDVRHLVWADEFNGSSIDASKWNFEIGNGVGGWGNTERQYYTANSGNARVINGNLEITARRESYAGFDYTSARMTTLNKGDFTYGRIEARLQSPESQSIWPAFWLLPTNWVYGGWPRSGEIDVFELIGSEPDRAHGTVHYGPAPGAGHFIDGDFHDLPGNPDYADGFHVFAVEWEPNEIRWYMDSVLYHSISPWEIAPCAWPFDQDMHILLNVAVGGLWPGYPNAATVLPQTMTVDYVRVYAPGPVAASDPVLQPVLTLSPNPSSGDFVVDLGMEPKGAVQLDVLDLQGRLVQTQVFHARQAHIALGDAPAGVYFVHVLSGKERLVSKLVKVD
jgi:beta-glucanase (GH16 family)